MVCAAFATVFGLVLAGCATGPSQVGAAAIIGDRSISVDQVQQMVDKVVQAEPAAAELAHNRKLDLVSRALVGQLVLHELLTHAAEREGLRLDESQVAQRFERNQLGAPLAASQMSSPQALANELAARARDPRQVYADQVLAKQLGEKYFDQLSVVYDYTVVAVDDPQAPLSSMRERALTKAEQLQAAGPDEAARMIAREKSSGGNAEIGQTVSLAEQPESAGSPLFGVPAGAVLALQLDPQDANWAVALVRERHQQDPGATGQAPPAGDEQLESMGQRLLQPLVDQVGVKISPRYGVWDAAAMNIAPSATETIGIVLLPKEATRP